MNQYMNIAVKEAFQGIRAGHGGPFGAVIVCNGEVIAQDHNRVLESNDPSAHAEMLVIRQAAQKLNRYDLSDCELYASCEPCPMCFAVIHWAKITQCYYGCTREDAARSQFDDKYLYDVIKGTTTELRVTMEQMDHDACIKPFQEWDQMEDREQY